MENVIMSQNQYNMYNLNFADEFKVIKDIVLFKDTILLSIRKKHGLIKVKYFHTKFFKYHYFKGTELIYVSNLLR